MKRITQKQCLQWANELPELTEQQKEYCIKNLPAIKFKWYGKEHVTEYNKKDVIECKRKVHGGCARETFYFVTVTTHNNVQLLRHFWAIKVFDIRGNVEVKFHEVFQNWIMPDGRRVITGKRITPQGGDFFDIYSGYSIKKVSSSYYYYFDYEAQYIVKTERFADYVRRRGVHRIPKWCTAVSYLERILSDDTYEKLLKMGVLNESMYNSHASEVRTYFRQIVLARRAGYTPKDWQMWLDCIIMRKELGYDINSRKYLCIACLAKEHEKLQRKVEHKKMEEELKVARKHNKFMIKNMGGCIGILIKHGDIEIRPLKNVEEVYEAGKIHKHCVFARKYYLVKDSLLLEAFVDGKPTETIEYDMVKNEVLQSRGTCNLPTKWHGQILEAMSHLKIYKNKTFKIYGKQS